MQTNSLISKLSSPLQQVIYLGAGIGQELPALLDLNAETIQLVEGDEEHQALLESEIECYPQVKLVKKLLSDRTGSATFYRYSLSELNSLQEGNGLQQLFPNVRLVEQQACQTASLVEWLNTLQLQQRDNLIWIDLPGQEAIIIRHLIEHQQLDLFDTLILYAHQQPCYEGQQSIDQIREILADQGYQLQQQNNDVDPDRPLLVMQRHSLYWENRELQITIQGNMQELTQANELIAKLAEEKQSISAKLNQLVSEKEALTSTQTELEKLLAELRKESEQSAKTKQEKITTLEAQLSESQKSKATSNDTINKLKADLDAQLKDKQSIIDKFKSLETKLSEAHQSAESKQAALAQLQKELTETKQLVQVKAEKLQQVEKQLTESQQSTNAKLEKLSELESQLTEVQQSAKAKQEKITSLEAQLSESQKSTATSNETINKLKADLDAQIKDKQSISDKAKSLEAQFAEAKQSVESKQATLTQLQKELTETKQSAQTKTEKLQQLEKQLAESQQSTKAKQQKITDLESQLSESQQSTKSIQEKLTALEAKYATLEEEKTKIHTYFVNRKKQAEEGEEKIKSLTEANTSLEQVKKTLTAEKENLTKDLETAKASLTTTQQALTQAQATIEALQNNTSQLQQLEEKMAALFSKQGQTMQEYTNALGQHVTRTAKSTAQNIESFLGMQKYLVQDGTPLQLNGSRLSSELALKLTERLHNTHYDLIIEFGTGTSTQLLAKALLKQERDKPHSQHLISRDSDHAYSTDLPKRIISFEHDKKAITPLSQQLEQQGLASLVELIFAPLSDYTHKGEDYLFYECKSKFKQLTQVFDQREAKILVLVDGPDTPNESLSRYPVLPLLLKHLATHQLDIIITQSHKHLPEVLMESWQSLLNKRCLAFQTQHLTQEKDATLIQINGE